jgi:cytochrome c oxidase cbb3-type subunit 4
VNPVWGHVAGVFIVLMLLTFIGIWVWAWGKRHRKVFRRMSEIPMEDPPEGPPPATVEPVPGEVSNADQRPADAARNEPPRGDQP